MFILFCNLKIELNVVVMLESVHSLVLYIIICEILGFQFRERELLVKEFAAKKVINLVRAIFYYKIVYEDEIKSNNEYKLKNSI